MEGRFHDRATRFAVTAALGAAMAMGVGCGNGPTFEVAPTPEDGGADETSNAIDAAPETERDAPPDTERGDSGIDSAFDAAPDTRSDGAREAAIDADAEVDRDGDVGADCDVPVFCYPDADADGYASPAGAFASCGACPSGSLAIDPASAKFDCDDLDPSVHPGVTAFSATPYCVPETSCTVKSFDDDCDGVETMEWTAIGSACATSGSGCAGDGWTAGKAPDCGATVGWLTCTRDLLSCKPSTSPRTQGCR